MKNTISVIGAGRWGRNHIRTLFELGLLGAVIDSHLESINWVKATYPIIPVFSSLSESGALDFDGYTIATPVEHHFSIARELLLNGKHVLVEKPITLDVVEAQELVTLAATNNCHLMVGHLLLFHPAFKRIKELISSGQLGKLQYMYSNRLNLGTVRTEENSLWSFAPHDFSLFQYFSQAQPINIASHGGAFLQPHIHDTTMTIVRYPDNVVGHIFVSWLHPFKEHRFVAIGSKGMLVYEDSSEQKDLLFYEKGIDWVNGEPIKREGATNVISFGDAQPLRDELTHFHQCIVGKESNTIIDGQKGVDVIDLLTKAQACLQPTYNHA